MTLGEKDITMKNRLIIILIALSVSKLCSADICPLVQNLSPQTPPAGWTLFQSPMFAGQNYYFVSATHSLNPTFYPNQVLCHYETCPAFGCPNFTLLSNATYQAPANNTAPWNIFPAIVNTLVCAPPNNDPQQCIFTNIPT